MFVIWHHHTYQLWWRKLFRRLEEENKSSRGSQISKRKSWIKDFSAKHALEITIAYNDITGHLQIRLNHTIIGVF